MKYCVMLSGENFELSFDGEIKNFGFVTTRWVKAENIAEAELKAVDLVKNDSDLLDSMSPNPAYAPMIYLEEISEARWWKKLGGEGFTFYEMESPTNDV